MSAVMSQVIDCLEASDMQGSMDQMIRLLGDQKDMQELDKAGQLLQHLQEVEQVQQDNLMKIIQGYVALKDVEESQVANNQTNQVVDKELAEAYAERQQKEQQKDVMAKECRAVESQLDQLDEEQRRLQEQRERVTEETTEILPKTRYNISLYGCATKLNWDFSGKPEEVKGYVCSNKDVRPFSLDSRQHSKYFITNYLWDLIEAVATPEK